MAVGIDHEIIGSTGKARLYASDNLFQGNFRYLADDLDQISVGSPPCPLTVKPVSSEEAYAKVLQAAGAFPRDSFDTRIVSEVKARDGHIKKQAGTNDIQKNSDPPLPDAAGDGMAGDWEASTGGDPGKESSGQTGTGDGGHKN